MYEIPLTNNPERKLIVDKDTYERAREFTWGMVVVNGSVYFRTNVNVGKKKLDIKTMVFSGLEYKKIRERKLFIYQANEDIFDWRRKNLTTGPKKPTTAKRRPHRRVKKPSFPVKISHCPNGFTKIENTTEGNKTKFCFDCCRFPTTDEVYDKCLMAAGKLDWDSWWASKEEKD